MSLTPTQKQINAFSEQVESSTWIASSENLDTMERLYESIDHASKEGIVLCFALAKVYDRLGQPEKCFNLLAEGNRHHKVGKTDTIEDARSTIRAVKNLFTSQTVSSLDAADNHQFIFIVGMPRSGTTLVEQILCSHPEVYGGGELKLMGQWCFGFLKLYHKYADQAQLDNYLPQLREHYLKGIETMTVRSFVTDKMPVNFLWIGFILSVFPQAKIIHTVRDPMAVCWSIFKTPFAGTSNGYSCDLEDIGEFYLLYRGLMDFWQHRFPDKIYDLHYERLTENQYTETFRLLEYCGLNWDDACLKFYRNSRKVSTVSRKQVQKPMYQGSSEAWKAYESYLGPLKDVLETAGDNSS